MLYLYCYGGVYLFAGFSWLLSPEVDTSDDAVVLSVEDIIYSEDFVRSQLDPNHVIERIAVNIDQIRKVAEQTVNQRDNPSWHMLVSLCDMRNRTSYLFDIVYSSYLTFTCHDTVIL